MSLAVAINKNIITTYLKMVDAHGRIIPKTADATDWLVKIITKRLEKHVAVMETAKAI